jgi:hypothetical protein
MKEHWEKNPTREWVLSHVEWRTPEETGKISLANVSRRFGAKQMIELELMPIEFSNELQNGETWLKSCPMVTHHGEDFRVETDFLRGVWSDLVYGDAE